MKKLIAAAITLATAFVTSLAAHGQDAPLDPDTGLPLSPPFDFPERGPAAPFWAKRLTGYFKTSDGIRLRYSVLLPKASGRFPVILSINGYDAGSIGGTPYLQYKTSMSIELDRRLVDAGYAVMGVNAAGSGCSAGPLEYTRPQLGRHGAEAVEFAASQAWSNAKVGMVNWSYGGSSQLATAQHRPPHLRAIVPGMVLTDFRDALMPGGVPAPGFITPLRGSMRAYWEKVVAQTAREEGDAACLAQIPKNLAAEDTNSVMHLFLSHPLRDERMKSFDLAPLDPARLWSVQTNGRHDMYLAADFQAMAVRFLDRFVKGENNGFERDTPRTTVWMESSEAGGNALERRVSARARWVVQRGSIRSDDLAVKAFHLGAGQTLADAPGSGAADSFDYPGAGVAVNDIAGRSFWGPLPGDWKTTGVAYTSPPLDEDMMVYGPGSADLWVTAGAGDADLQVTVTELRPDGQEIYVQRGWLRLSNRALDTARSTPLLPVRLERPEQPMPLLPGRPVLARVEIHKMGHYFRAGSRLRIWIDTPAQTGGLVFDTFTQKQRVHVLHNARYDSVVRLGVLKDVKGPAGYPACGETILQPCRPDPLAIR
ncbi:MAG: CocE/NonD family hydrolase [Burkholderiales bacterium]|nr:CocE/NonD family hydrolase [Burkholderiales bacterium]